MKMSWKVPLLIAAVGGSVAFVTLNGWAKERVGEVIRGLAAPKKAAEPTDATAAAPDETPDGPWDGSVAVDVGQQEALGIEVVTVKAQAEPLQLEVSGITAYDPETQTHIRPKFLSRVDKVYVRLGEHVIKGEPLVDLFSSDLAEAKGHYEEMLAQWERDKGVLKRSTDLYKQKAMSEKDYLDDVNDERKSHQEYQIARDRLEVLYGLSPLEIAAIKSQSGTGRARLTLCSPIDGFVIKRDVVPDNLYDVTSLLLVIAPLDKFWVWGNIYPSEASLVKVGQTWLIDCQFLGRTVPRKVEVVTPQVDPETKTIRIGTTIENIEGRMKADMLVSGRLEVEPEPGATVIPRVAMVTADGAEFVFVRRADDAERFERRTIRISREGHDRVVVLDGLKPGEQVVARGSLILAQMYEDAALAQGGPAK